MAPCFFKFQATVLILAAAFIGCAWAGHAHSYAHLNQEHHVQHGHVEQAGHYDQGHHEDHHVIYI